MKQRMIIGITGASGIIYGIKLLTLLKTLHIETHLVVSKSAYQTINLETNFNKKEIVALADVYYQNGDIAASIASGSFQTMGMIIAPCSMKTLAEIASGIGANLIARAADVILKERRRLVLLTRETPLHQIHLKNMLTITEMGGIIAPPVPAFYPRPQDIDELVTHTVGRVLDLFNLEHNFVKRWCDENR